MNIDYPNIQAVLKNKLMSYLNGMYILTDTLDYTAIDQVFPLFAEQAFFLNEMLPKEIQDANVLEIGLGSGVLSIGAARAGAKQITALEINPRAKNFAGFNILINGVEDKIAIQNGNTQNIWLPVAEQQFDYIISNPPFEPTPIGMNYFYHSAAGPYGLDFLEKLFKGLDKHLTIAGHAQIVTAAPGNAQLPLLLLELIPKYLSGTTTVILNPYLITFDEVMDRLAIEQIGAISQIEELRNKAQKDGITHLHLCVIHYAKGDKQLRIEQSKQVYEQYWDLPSMAIE